MALHAQSPHHKHRLQFSQSTDEPSRKPKILIVEDDTLALNTYITRFEEEGYIVIPASDGEVSLELAVREMPDIIVTGILMSKISGFDMIDILKTTPQLKHIPVIICSALSDQQDIDRGLKLGAVEYLVKSKIALEDLVAAVKKHTPKA